MTRFILLRHGQTDWNLQHLYQGQSDIRLNQTGIEQAREAAEALKHEKIDAAYSSDLSRASETAKAVLRYHPQTPLVIDPILRERAFGDLEGTPYQRDLLNPAVRDLIDKNPYAYRFSGGGESLEDVLVRARKALEQIAAKHPNQNVLLVSHGTFIGLFIIALKGLPIAARKDYVIGNAVPIFVSTNETIGGKDSALR